tara:strand:+ start:943 stop:1566 length:624 start_codon:yes stop_codon:yes gene_type:complete
MKRTKYKLPTHGELTHIKIDLDKLQAATDKLANEYVNVKTANKALCDNHLTLSRAVYDNFKQITLTELNGEELPFTTDIKERLRRCEEKLYNKPNDKLIGSYFEEIINQFKCDKMRVRITKLDPHTDIPFHIDYDPSYATRVVIPVYTNKKCKNRFKVKDETVETHLEAGKAYFFNTGFAHGVFNNSDEPRIAFMFSLDGQDDIEYL